MTPDGQGASAASAPASSGTARPPFAVEQAEAVRQLIEEHAEVVRQLHAEHARILVVLRTELDGHRGELDGAQQQIQVLSGRTERHEAGQQLARDATRELETLRERMETESAQRRELAQRILLFIDRERSGATERESAQQAIVDRIQALEERSQIESDQLRRLLTDAGPREAAAAGIEERLSGAEHAAAAARDQTRHTAERIAHLGSAADSLRAAVDDLAVRLGVIATDQRRVGEEVGSLRASRRDDAGLLDALEQQRAHRHRLEARFAELEERVVQERALLDAAQEGLALVRGEAAGIAERLVALGDAVDGEREAVLEHVRRSARAQEEAARRRSAELDREVRVTNELIAKLAEAPDRAVEDPAEEQTR